MQNKIRQSTEIEQPIGLDKTWNIEILPNFKAVVRSGQIINLTEKEYYILEYLMSNQGRTISRDELINEIWKRENKPNNNNLSVRINFLRKKMDKDYFPRLLHTRRGFGYIFYPFMLKSNC